MLLEDATVLVTGANRGIGAEFVAQLKSRGAAKIYAAARDAGSIDVDGVEPIQLDITDTSQVEAAASMASDVQILINNAGISTGTSVISGAVADIRREMDTNFFGPLLMTQAFAPILKVNGGGAVLNVVSALLVHSPGRPGLTPLPRRRRGALPTARGSSFRHRARTSSACTWASLTRTWPGGLEAPKISPAALATARLDAIESGLDEVLADDWAKLVKAGLTLSPSDRYKQLFTS